MGRLVYVREVSHAAQLHEYLLNVKRIVKPNRASPTPLLATSAVLVVEATAVVVDMEPLAVAVEGVKSMSPTFVPPPDSLRPRECVFIDLIV